MLKLFLPSFIQSGHLQYREIQHGGHDKVTRKMLVGLAGFFFFFLIYGHMKSIPVKRQSTKQLRVMGSDGLLPGLSFPKGQ